MYIFLFITLVSFLFPLTSIALENTQVTDEIDRALIAMTACSSKDTCIEILGEHYQKANQKAREELTANRALLARSISFHLPLHNTFYAELESWDTSTKSFISSVTKKTHSMHQNRLFHIIEEINTMPTYLEIKKHLSTFILSQEEKDYLLFTAAWNFDTIAPIKALIELGASVDAKDRNEKTPFDYAMRNNNTHVANFLQNKSYSTEPPPKIILEKKPFFTWQKPYAIKQSFTFICFSFILASGIAYKYAHQSMTAR